MKVRKTEFQNEMRKKKKKEMRNLCQVFPKDQMNKRVS